MSIGSKVMNMSNRKSSSSGKAGTIIDDADLFIAACAKVHGLALVTNNVKHFKRIKGLKLKNWV